MVGLIAFSDKAGHFHGESEVGDMYFLLFGFWVLLNGRWTAEIAIVGAIGFKACFCEIE